MPAPARAAADFRLIRLFAVEAAIRCAALDRAVARSMRTDILDNLVIHAVSPMGLFR
jgi:hypothetical protein